MIKKLICFVSLSSVGCYSIDNDQIKSGISAVCLGLFAGYSYEKVYQHTDFLLAPILLGVTGYCHWRATEEFLNGRLFHLSCLASIAFAGFLYSREKDREEELRYQRALAYKNKQKEPCSPGNMASPTV